MGRKDKQKLQLDDTVNLKTSSSSKYLNDKELYKKLSVHKLKDLNARCNRLLSYVSDYRGNETVASQWEMHKDVYHMLGGIMKIESDLNVLPLPERNDDVIKEFTNWVLDNEGVINGVGIENFGSGYGYGMKAHKDIKVDEVVIKIPRKIMMTIEKINDSPLNSLFNDNILLREMSNIALALFLLVERFRRDKPSFWLPYINALPNSYSTPLYFKLEEFEELRGSPAFVAGMNLCRNIARQYAYFRNLFLKNNDAASNILRNVFTYEQYRWAVCSVMTRQNFIPSEESKAMNALIPFWDFCNHTEYKKSSAPSAFYNFEDHCSVVEALKDFSSGEQVFIYYGHRSNAEFLVHNGFIYDEHKTDKVHVKFGISHSDPHASQRTALLEKFNLPTSYEFFVQDKCDDPFQISLITFIRIFKMTAETLDNWLVNEELYKLLACPLFSYAAGDCNVTEEIAKFLYTHDLQVLAYLQTRMLILMKSYPTSIKTDNELLDSGELSANRKLAIMLRLKEKQILKRASDYCSMMTAINSKGDSPAVKDDDVIIAEK